jgi:ribonuclease HI
VANIRRATPTAALEIAYGVEPLDLYLKEAVSRTFVWLGQPPGSNYSGHLSKLSKMIPEQCRTSMYDACIAVWMWKTNFTMDISHGSDNTLNDLAYRAYTDGSLLSASTRVGVGALVLRNNKQLVTFSGRLTNRNSVFQAEIYAIKMAAEYLTINADPGTDVHILVDSQASIKALGNTILTSTLVLHTRLILNRLGEKHKVVVPWIKAHAAWIYNEAANTAAKAGANSNKHCFSPLTPLDDLKMELKIDKLKALTNRWQTTNPARQSKFFLTGPNQKLTKQLLLLPKFNLS